MSRYDVVPCEWHPSSIRPPAEYLWLPDSADAEWVAGESPGYGFPLLCGECVADLLVDVAHGKHLLGTLEVLETAEGLGNPLNGLLGDDPFWK